MAEPRNPLVLKVSLIAFIIAAFVYGLGFFLFPGFMIRLTGFTGMFYGGWVNWAGGMLIALAIGAALALPNTKNQGILITTLALVTFFIGITLLYNWITIEGASLGFAGVPALINLLLSGMLWWSLFKARDFLKSAQG